MVVNHTAVTDIRPPGATNAHGLQAVSHHVRFRYGR
jgi:hypothetical protein